MTEQTRKHVVVTGGSRGIGLSAAQGFAKAGYTVSLIARDGDRLEHAAKELAASTGGSVTGVAADIANESEVNHAFTKLRAVHGPVDCLINNAGIAESAAFSKTTLASWNKMLGTNLTGVFLCTKAVVDEMITRKSGRIINVASTAGITGYGYVSAYCAAKHGVVGLTRSLAKELAKHNISVNCVCPGFTMTDILKATIHNSAQKTGRSEAEIKQELLADNPSGRFVTPEEVASCIVWLCKEEQRSINGAAIPISGGEVA